MVCGQQLLSDVFDNRRLHITIVITINNDQEKLVNEPCYEVIKDYLWYTRLRCNQLWFCLSQQQLQSCGNHHVTGFSLFITFREQICSGFLKEQKCIVYTFIETAIVRLVYLLSGQ